EEHMKPQGPSNSSRRRIVLIAAGIGAATCLAVIVGITWAILYIHKENSELERVHAEITKVVSVKRSALTRGIRFGKYVLDVRYRTKDGQVATYSIEKTTYGFPSAGDSIELLFDPSRGSIEPDPFPEMWFVMAGAYAFLGGLVFFFIRAARFAGRL
ncbi:MAG TPA: DUF3592 domain-containing protein, partial [Bryobacteraceae bacterium]